MIKVGTTEVTNIHLAGWDVQRAYVGGDLVFQAQKPSRLPAGYMEVEWISSYKGDSTYSACYINPKDLANRSTLKIEIDAQIMQNYSSAQNMAYSTYYTGSYYQCFMRYRNNSFYAGASVFSSSSGTSGTLIGASNLTRKLYTLDILGKKASVGSISKSITVDVSKANTLSLFGGITSSARARYFGGKIYSNGIITHEFIPCIKDDENLAGLYDILNNVFYKSEGSTEYDAGPAV